MYTSEEERNVMTCNYSRNLFLTPLHCFGACITSDKGAT